MNFRGAALRIAHRINTRHDRNPRLAETKKSLLLYFFLKCSEHLIVHLPSLENGDGSCHAESGAHQGAEDTRCFAVVLRLFEPLAFQERARLLAFVDARVSFINS